MQKFIGSVVILSNINIEGKLASLGHNTNRDIFIYKPSNYRLTEILPSIIIWLEPPSFTALSDLLNKISLINKSQPSLIIVTIIIFVNNSNLTQVSKIVTLEGNIETEITSADPESFFTSYQ